MPIRVLIVDDGAIFAGGLRVRLRTEPTVEVVAKAADGEIRLNPSCPVTHTPLRDIGTSC